MESRFRALNRYGEILAVAVGIGVLYIVSFYNYLLFHSLAEIFSIVIACGIFFFAWNSRQFLENDYFLFLGIGYVFIGGIDLLHTLSYKGVNVFEGYGANLPTQLCDCRSIYGEPDVVGCPPAAFALLESKIHVDYLSIGNHRAFAGHLPLENFSGLFH